MVSRIEPEELRLPLLMRLAVMVECRLVSYREIVPWADRLIERLDVPPHWLLNLAMTQYNGDVARILREGAEADRLESWNLYPPGPWRRTDEAVACYFLRHERAEISWATFLDVAGRAADANSCRRECEEFFGMLNDLEDAAYSQQLAASQREDVAAGFGDVIESVRDTYEHMRRFRSSRA